MPIDQMFAAMRGAGPSGAPVSREQALSVAAVQQGRRMIGAVATLPLAAYRLVDNALTDNPLFRQIDPDVPNVVTLGQTIDDLLFEAVSWWLVTARDFDGFPVAARHLDLSSVVVRPANGRNTPAPLPSGIDPRGASVYVDGVWTPWSDLIRFDSPAPPLLVVGAKAIRRALALDAAAEIYATDPRPLDYFTPTDGAEEYEDEDVEQLLADWRLTRKRRATGYVPAALKYNEVTAPSPQQLQLVELQRQASLDIANSMGVEPEDVGVSTTSRTYQNATERRQHQVNATLAPFMRAVTDRLSMGDVTRRGYVVRFDLDDFLKANASERWGNYKTAVEMGAMTIDEVRSEEGLPTLTSAPEPAGPPAKSDGAQADARPGHTFDGRPMTFDVELTEFSVDMDARTIVGLAVPYGKLAKGVVFAPGSLKWSDPSRVKLLRDHDPKQPLGYATELTETPKGLKAKFKVGRGPEGDAALILAEDKVLDGLSIGVDFDFSADVTPHTKFKGAVLVHRADLRETSLTAVPAFDDARVTKVAASRDQEVVMTDVVEPTAPAAPATTPEQTAQFAAFLEWQNAQNATPAAAPERPAVVNPTRPVAFVSEPQPYRFDRAGRFVPGQEHCFSVDLHAMALENDIHGTKTLAGRRVFGLMRAAFDVDSADVNEVNPEIQRPDMYVDQREYRTPLWNFVSKGAPPNGIQPFRFPKFNAATGLVGDHTEGTEPTGGTQTTTSQLVEPTALSGKAYLTREVWDMGGNPAVDTLIWNQMMRGYREGLESATATFLATLSAAANIDLLGADEELAADWNAALAALQFTRGYDFEAFALDQGLFTAFAGAVDTTGSPLYPMIGAQNRNGSSRSRFQTLDLGGVTGVPSWALGNADSWLFDPTTVHGWATAPQRLEFPGGSDDNTTYQPVAKVGIGIWGYKAFACSDIAGVRQVTWSFS